MKRRKRRVTIDAQMQKLARSIYESGMADAMKAAALVMAARKLDEVRALLVASGLSSNIAAGMTPPLPVAVPPQPMAAAPSPPVIKHPCVQCGREGVYRTKPNQWNQTGSWFCRAHAVLGQSAEVDDAIDRRMNFAPPPNPAPVHLVPPAQPQPQPSPAGASTMAEAFGMAELIDESS